MTKLHYFFEHDGVGPENFCIQVIPSSAMTSGLSASQADDFKELQDAGITHPDAEKIKALLTAEAGAR